MKHDGHFFEKEMSFFLCLRQPRNGSSELRVRYKKRHWQCLSMYEDDYLRRNF